MALAVWLIVRVVWPAPSHRPPVFFPLPHPGAGEPLGYSGGSGALDRPSYFAPVIAAGRPVTIVSVTPILDKGSAPAGMFVFLCDLGSDGFSGLDKPDGCHHPVPFHAVVSGAGGPWVGLAVTPLAPGTVRIDGFRVSYRDHGLHTVNTGEPVEVVVAD